MGESKHNILDADTRSTEGGLTMVFKFAIQTVFEITAVIAVIVGFIREDKFIAFEERIFERMKHK